MLSFFFRSWEQSDHGGIGRKCESTKKGAEAPEPLPGGGRRRGTVPGCPPPAPPARAHVWGVVLTAEMTDVLMRVFYVRD